MSNTQLKEKTLLSFFHDKMPVERSLAFVNSEN